MSILAFSKDHAVPDGAGITFSIEKLTYNPGEEIRMALRVFNYTEKEVTFRFRTAQRYDFSIEDMSGRILWRWSEDRMFAMVLGSEVLSPKKREIIYAEVFRGSLEPGSYRLTGILTAENPVSAILPIEIK